MTIWVNKTNDNFQWALEHGLALGEEYTHRYDKIHSSHEMLQDIQKLGIQGNSNYKKKKPKKRPGRHSKRPNKHSKQKRYRRQGRKRVL